MTEKYTYKNPRANKTSNKRTQQLDTDILLLEELLAEEMYAKSEKSLFQFFVNFWNCHDPATLHTSWLQQILSEHIEAALRRDIRRLAINVPPRSGKSTLGSISVPAWWWINNSDEKFWLISHSSALFTQNITLCRRILDHPLYKNRWLNSESEDYRYSLSKDVNRVTKIENMSGGYILGGSHTSGALGMGYTVAILDDVLDSEVSTNILEVKKVNNWYTQTFLNRSNDNANDVQIILMQRLAEEDLTGYVTKKYPEQDWFILNLPARYDPDRIFFSPIGFNDPRKQRNELLDPVRLPDSFLLLQAKDPILYNTRFQQNPEGGGDGNIVHADWIQETHVKPVETIETITVWDTADTDHDSSDYSVGLTITKWNDEFHIIDMWRKQVKTPELMDGMRLMKRKYPKAHIGVEARNTGRAVVSLLEREVHDIYLFEPRKFGGDKEQRLAAVLPYFRDKKVFIYNPFIVDAKVELTYNPERIKKELIGFPLVKGDDIVDCISYGIQYLAEYGQVSTGMVTQGNKILLSSEDYIDERMIRQKEYNVYNYGEYDFNDSYTASRDDLISLPW